MPTRENNLPHIAAQIRIDALRMIYAAQSGHPGSSFSCTDILVTLFFGGFLKFDATNPKWNERDYFIMSKRTRVSSLYAVLGELGYFSKDEFYRLRQVIRFYRGIRKHSFRESRWRATVGARFECRQWYCTGSSCGWKTEQSFSLHGDGELQEGTFGEAAMTSAKYGIDHLVSFVDRNKLQIDGPTAEVKPVGDVAEKFRAFGWEVFETNGHDFTALSETITKAIEVVESPFVLLPIPWGRA